MTKEEYLKQLELALIEKNVPDYLDIVEKYRKRFELATLADMSVEDAIKMMGSVESVVGKYLGDENTEYFDVYSFKLEDALASKIIVKKGEKGGIVINVDEELIDKLNISHQDKKVSISNKFGKSLFRKMKGTILIEIGDNVKFDKFEIGTVSSDVDVCGVNSSKCSIHSVSGDFEIEKIISDDVNLTTVSGDFKINRIKTNQIKITTVSGDANIAYIEAEKAIFETVSGDINVCGKLKLRRGTSISGTINYQAIN